jgi:hypothetical protein
MAVCLYPTWWGDAQPSTAPVFVKTRVIHVARSMEGKAVLKSRLFRHGSSKQMNNIAVSKPMPISRMPISRILLVKPTVVLHQPPPAHHFSWVKGRKWFGTPLHNRNYMGKGIPRVEKEFVVV